MLPPMISLVLGGTRSGKSEVAEALTLRMGAPATYLATGRATDADMADRIATHQERRRRSRWANRELEPGGDLAGLLDELPGPVLVDSLGTWLAGFPDLDPDVGRLCAALQSRRDHGAATVLVSEEVGLGVHAMTEVGRRFADRLGSLNRAVADQADSVLLVVAGRVLPLPPAGASW
jgi:adenosyl cobinamide kinase/adenosyl cobinamide phosphate guanylyltransferase